MALKDHYRTLGLASTATMQEVKKTYRLLAHQYHPDKDQENPFAAARFREIQEAYSILGDEKKRKLYDEERYFAGLSSTKEPAAITSKWILQQAKKLSAHMRHLDSYWMNHRALHDYVMLLLSDAHIAVIQSEHNPDVNRQLVEEILLATKGLQYIWFSPIAQRLSMIAGNNERLIQEIFSAAQEKKKKTTSEKYLPLIVLLVTLLLCLIMFFYSRR